MTTIRRNANASQRNNQRGYYIYEAPVRLWHWIAALSIVVFTAVTGYFIGRPCHRFQGEATFMFWMGWITTDPFYHGVSLYAVARCCFVFTGHVSAMSTPRECFTRFRSGAAHGIKALSAGNPLVFFPRKEAPSLLWTQSGSGTGGNVLFLDVRTDGV